MQDAYDLLAKILAVFKLPLTWWTVTLFIILYFLRDRLTKGISNLLDWLGRNIATDIGSRRFVPEYNALIRANHLHLKIVGIRTEEERRPEITDAYVPLMLLQQGDTIDHAISVDQMLRNQSYNIILGDPGAGKSTILDYIIVQAPETAPKQKSHARVALAPVGVAKRRTHTPRPIYVPFRRCSMEHRTLLEDILDESTEILPLPVRKAMPKKFIEHCLKKGNALLLLDGLDEVMHEKAYDAAIRKINEFTQLYPGVNVVITCRKAGWRGGLNPNFSIYSLLSLDAQQQHSFVHKWYPSVLRYAAHGTATSQQEILRRAEREANSLLTLLRTRERLRELASNPLILSLICLVHKQRKDLPRGRTALYQDCLDILLELWDREDKDYDQTYPTTDQKKHFLRCMAYRMHNHSMSELDRRTLENWVVEFLPGIQDKIAPAEIVRQIEVRSGIMAERAIDLLAFSHLTFQEFLVVEYFNNQSGGGMDLNIITDWSAWREPVLLMCGMSNNPMPFLSALYKVQPLLALHGIAEVDFSRLDRGIAQGIINNVISRIQNQEVALDAAIPALVELLSVKDNPFANSIIRFIDNHIHASSMEEISKLVFALSKIPTRESAKVLLAQLSVNRSRKAEDICLGGLARIGDPAVYEALEWRRQGWLTEGRFFKFLVECYTPFASKTLWMQYELEPPQGLKFIWARSWALRLADQEHDQALRSFSLPAPGITDPETWPYRQNDASAIAAIVQKAVSILTPRYKNITAIHKDLDTFSKFSLRIQAPLLVRANLNTKDDQAVGAIANALHVGIGLGVSPGSKKLSSFSIHHLYTIGHFLRGKQKITVWERVLQSIALAIDTISCITVSAGIVSLFLPDGNLFHFFMGLPFGWQIVAIITLTSAIVGVWLWFLHELVGDQIWFRYWMVGVRYLFRYGLRGARWTDIFIVSLACVLPMCLFYEILFNDSRKTIEQVLSFKKMKWGAVVYVLIGSLIVGTFSFFAIHRWFVHTASPYLYISVLSIICLLGIVMGEYALAFSKNDLAEWLKKHPRGKEVIDECMKGI